MKSISMGKPLSMKRWQQGGQYALGLLAGACQIGGYPFGAVGLLGAYLPKLSALPLLLGGITGTLLLSGFSLLLRCWAELLLVAALLSALRGTSFMERSYTRSLAAAVSVFSVELVYRIQLGDFTAACLGELLAVSTVTALTTKTFLALHRPLAPTPPMKREADLLRQRLLAGAAAVRSLAESLAAPAPPKKEENPAVVFDRAARLVCRSCTLRDLCWNQEYISTFNAFNDATPAMMERGKAEPADFPDHFSLRCIHFPQLLSAINTEVTALLLRRQYQRQLEQERNRTRRQYAQLGELVAETIAAAEAPPCADHLLPFTVSMSAVPKAGHRLCGDSVTHFQSGNLLHLFLSDGMGSGREAQRESQLAMRLTEQFLTAGIQPEAALGTLNGALHLRWNEQGSFTTLDLLTVRLTDYQATLYKYGTAPTYVKRNGTVRRFTANSLPAGLQDSPPLPVRISLEGDTFVLMVSDGVADSTDDRWLLDLLTGWQGDNPHLLVSLVLKTCQERRGGDDDCSAVCLYLPPS